jgi:inner membrane protein
VSPITHLLASWTLSEFTGLPRRDRHLVAWCGVLPDLDGMGVLLDLAHRILGRAESGWYEAYHHSLLHGLAGALLIPAILAIFGTRRIALFLWGVLAIHVHLFCDLLGSRGPTAQDIWSIPYFAPFSSAWTLSWKGQWALDAWPNLAITVSLLGFVFVRAASGGDSPLTLVSEASNGVFVSAVQYRWRRIRRVLRMGRGG